MNDLLDLAKTKDEYLLVTMILCQDRWPYESGDVVRKRLAEFRALPRSVDCYPEEDICSTGQKLIHPIALMNDPPR